MKTAEQPNSRTAEQPNSRTAEQQWSSLSKFLIFCFFLLFSVHCSKGKKNGLGLGILLLAGGSSSSSSSDNATNSVNPKQPGGGGNGGDDPNNAPEFDEIKQKIEKNIKFPTGNENKVLSNDFNADFSITGDFFSELGKLEKLSLEHSVSAGSKKTNPTKIDITKKFLTDQKIPLTLDLSSIQPEIGLARPKLKLKFSSNDKQIIQKEWTQKMILKGKKQNLLFTGKNGNNLTEGVVYNSSKTVKIEAENIEPSIQVRVEASSEDVSAKDATGNFSPINIPTKDKSTQKEKDLSLDLVITRETNDNHYLVKARTFFRFTNSENWKPLDDTVYRVYSIAKEVDPTIKLDKVIVTQGETVRVTLEKFQSSPRIIAFWIGRTISGSDKFLDYGNGSSLTKLKVGDVAVEKADLSDWLGIDYFSDADGTQAGNIVNEGDFIDLKGIKKSLTLLIVHSYSGLAAPKQKNIKILVRP